MSTLTGFLPLTADGPAYRPSANGLLAAATVREDASLRWSAGVTFESNAGVGALGTVVTDGCAPWDKSPTITDTWLDGLIVVLYAWWQCAPVGYTAAERQARARALFSASESRALEKVLWEWWLAHDTATALATPVIALGTADDAIAVLYGGEGMIHTSCVGGTLVAQQLTRSGQQLRTTAGNTRMAIGDGYGLPANLAAKPPAPSDVHYIATGPIDIVRGPLEDLTPDAASGMNRAINDLTAVVERAYLVLIDQPQGAVYTTPVVATP